MGLLLVVCQLTTAAVGASSKNADWQIQKLEWSQDREGLTKVVATNLWGEMRIRRSDNNRIRISAHAQQADVDALKPQIQAAVEDGTLTVEVAFLRTDGSAQSVAERQRTKVRIDVTLLLPEGLELEARVGDDLLQASGLRSKISASSESGNLDLASHDQIIARSTSGRIAAAFLSQSPAPGSSFETKSGDITLWFDWQARAHISGETDGRVTSDVSTKVMPFPGGPRKTVEAFFGEAPQELVEVRSGNGNLSFLRRAP